MSSEVPVGLYRTYVYIPPDEEFTYESWCRHLRAGRTFHSGGPLTRLRGGWPADRRHAEAARQRRHGGGRGQRRSRSCRSTAWRSCSRAGSWRPPRRQPARGGCTYGPGSPSGGHTWLAARVGGPGYVNAVPHHDVWRRGIMAHTSPVYVAVGGRLGAVRPGGGHLHAHAAGGQPGLYPHAQPAVPPGTVTHFHGEADHQAFLERPFQEALQAIHARMHQHSRPQ